MSKKSICAILLGFSVLLGSFILTGCDEVPPPPPPPDLSEDVVSPEPDSNLLQDDVEIFEWEHELLEHETFENVGRTSANVRWYFVEDGIRWQHQSELIFDLNQVEKYHEAIIREGLRIVFTTDATVRDFRLLEIRHNTAENERRYIVESVLYTLDELAPEIPLVVTGASLGCAVAVNGFSFVDEDGATRYFIIQQSGKTGNLVYGEF